VGSSVRLPPARVVVCVVVVRVVVVLVMVVLPALVVVAGTEGVGGGGWVPEDGWLFRHHDSPLVLLLASRTADV
ncbi:hypothetical protein, partial [Plantactinospora endophytica]|uniref:hypothetical protein n=1 Tax=Plantactinospora endophytica TaxID=673535 RepID=UPI00362C348B